MREKFNEYVIEFLEIVCQIFMNNPLSELLYSLEVLVGCLGKDPNLSQIFTKAYEIISESTLNFMDKKDFKEHDELLEDFFGLLFRYTKYMPSVILSSRTLETNLKLAELSLGINQPNVEKTLFLFLEYIFKLCNANPRNDMEKVNLTKIVDVEF